MILIQIAEIILIEFLIVFSTIIFYYKNRQFATIITILASPFLNTNPPESAILKQSNRFIYYDLTFLQQISIYPCAAHGQGPLYRVP